MLEGNLYEKGLMSKLAPSPLDTPHIERKSKLAQLAEQHATDTDIEDLDRPLFDTDE